MTRWLRYLLIACVTFLVSAAPALAGSKAQRFQIVVPGVSAFTATLPADSVATYRWQPGASSVESWVTTPWEAEASEKEPGVLTGVVAQSPIPFTSRTNEPEITVEPLVPQLQELTGFGGAMTESAALVMEAATYPNSVFDLLFGSPAVGGAGLTIARVPIGPSDFTAIPELPAEEPKYTGANDQAFLVPALKHAKAVNPALKLLATPWSAPPGFKVDKEKPSPNLSKTQAKKFCENSNDNLENSRYAEYAHYLTEAVSFYENEGLPIWMLSLQNEPHNCKSTYPTMKLEPKDEAELAGYLHTDLKALQSPPELLGWDHNWRDYNDNPKNSKCKNQGPASYPETLFGFSPPIQALGYHSYCPGTPKVGPPQAPGGAAAGIPFYVTESTGFDDSPTASSNLVNEVQSDLIDPLRVGAKGSVYWNLALNEHCGPQYAGTGPNMTEENGHEVCKTPTGDKYTGCVACRPLITVDAAGHYRVNQDYYYWAQLSKFFPPGAHVIASSTSEGLDSIAARYPNGTIVVTVLNGANAKAIPPEPHPGSTDLGTIAGGDSWAADVNESGQVVGSSDNGTGGELAFSWTQAGGMIDLGTLGGGDSDAAAVNSSGEVVGSAEVSSGIWHAFSWTQAGGMIDLGTLGGGDSDATAVNSSGEVVGSAEVSSGIWHAFSWTKAGGMIDLGTLGGSASEATAVNSLGQVVGRAETSSGNGAWHAFLWTQAGGMIDLGALGNSNFSSGARAVNDSGQVVGTTDATPFSWTKAGGMIDLGTLGGSGNTLTSEATAVNSSGQVVGIAETSSGNWHGFSWTQAGGMIDLGALGGAESDARAVNSSGEIVGSSLTSSNTWRQAFSWTQAGGMIDLGTLGGPSSEATAVNSSGQAAGTASTTSGALHATLWQTPTR